MVSRPQNAEGFPCFRVRDGNFSRFRLNHAFTGLSTRILHSAKAQGGVTGQK
jgi:hypothetical protein